MQSPDKWFAAAGERRSRHRARTGHLGAAPWPELPNIPPGAYLSVNVSPEVLTDAKPLLRTVDGTRLVIEVTEHEMVDDYDTLTAATADLRARGVRFAIDDAGARATPASATCCGCCPTSSSST